MRPVNTFHIVVALDKQHGIGRDGKLAWSLPGDMAFFKRLTTSVSDPAKVNAVIMGRITWDSIPTKFRPLRGRLNIVISRQSNFVVPDGVIVVNNFESALSAAWSSNVGDVFVIGGGAIYSDACQHAALSKIYCTEILSDFECDTFFPQLDSNMEHLKEEDSALFCENGINYVFKTYQKRPSGSATQLITNEAINN